MKLSHNELEMQINQMKRNSYDENINLINKKINSKIKTSKQILKTRKEGENEGVCAN